MDRVMSRSETILTGDYTDAMKLTTFSVQWFPLVGRSIRLIRAPPQVPSTIELRPGATGTMTIQNPISSATAAKTVLLGTDRAAVTNTAVTILTN
jgi:hypothetical protein